MAAKTMKVASLEEFRALTKPQQTAMVLAVAKMRDLGSREGGSGDDIRSAYGDWLTGPRRCKLFREFGFEDRIGPSYVEYDDPNGVEPVTGGRTRTGSKHAKWHGNGAKAEERREEALAAAKPARKPRRVKAAKKATAA